MAQISVHLLGGFQVERNGETITHFRGDKVRALLAYLAVEANRPHTRAALAGLFWAEQPEELALRNLSQALVRLRQALGASDVPLLITRETVQWRRDAARVDVLDFIRLAESNQPAGLEQVLDLYRGELLAGFALRGCEAFEEWLLVSREQLQDLALSVLDRAGEEALATGKPGEAAEAARRQLALDPWREPAYRQLMRALVAAGDRAAALAAYARCRLVLREELDLSPDDETRRLAERIQSGEMRSGVESPATVNVEGPLHNLPAPLASFVGREDELARLTGSLLGETRLESVVGAGGSGKSRLALAAAWALRPHFPQGVWWISLATFQAGDDLALQRANVVSAVGAALGLAFGGRRPSLEDLAAALRDRAALLVLDNCEHLIEAATVAHTLLEAAPHLRLLATSREPLGLEGETLLRLEGLPVPEDGAPNAGSYPGVQLFLERAGRHAPGWGQEPAQLAGAVSLCRILEGLPLGIELAAHWVGHYTPDEIATAIQTDLTFITSRTRTVPERHRSLRAVFDYSWSLLTQIERQALAQLSVFHGSFDRSAALTVAGVTPSTLVRLVDKSLLRQAGVGHYNLHELLRQFAAEQLALTANTVSDAVEERHCDYYLTLLAEQDRVLYGPDARSAVETLRRQLGDIRQAWSWALEHRRDDLLTNALEAMVRFWELASLFDEADSTLARAVARLERRVSSEPSEESVQVLYVQTLIWQAHFHEMRDRVDEAIETAERALALAQGWDDGDGAAEARSVLGETLPHRGEFAHATVQLERACSHYERRRHPRNLARSLRRLGIVHWRAGDYPRANEVLDRVRVMQQSLGDHWELARLVTALAGIAFEQGNVEGALTRAQEALRLYQALGDRRNIAVTKGNLALVYRRLERFDLALEHNQHDLEMSRELGDRHDIATALGNRGGIYEQSGNLDQALLCMQEALRIEEELENVWDAARHRAALAHVFRLRGELSLAIGHYSDSLPVLREYGAPYFAVLPLLDAAELQIELGSVETATELMQEASAIAHELGMEDEVRRSRALEDKITAG